MTPIPKPSGSKQSLVAFLESAPPGSSRIIGDLYVQERPLLSDHLAWMIATPDINLYCASDACKGFRLFAGKRDSFSSDNRAYLVYKCKNCNHTEKAYAILAPEYGAGAEGIAYKVGEVPPFGATTPSRVISLIGPDKELFLKGRRAEIHGLGVGAFAYYRRVVENQKVRIISEIEEVSKRLRAPAEMIERFEKAKQETQFSRAIDEIKDAIPQSLLIRGENPLRLLHTALSEGLHAKDDDECLEIATSIRVVLSELAERISTALKDEQELQQAVSRLLQRRATK